jgi:hypothetical protein
MANFIKPTKPQEAGRAESESPFFMHILRLMFNALPFLLAPV